MPMYARLWIDILGDPKLLRAADEGAKNLVILPWLIVWAKRADASGRIETSGKPSNPREIARTIPNVSPRQVGKSLQELEAIHVLEKDRDGCYRFTSWDYRNSGKASDSKEAVADRVRKHRERKKQQRAGNESQLDLSAGNTSNALPVTDVTSKRVERREEREESREEREIQRSSRESREGVTRVTRSHPPRQPLPDAAREFGKHFYRTAPPSRQRDVKRQLLATLNGGARLRKGVKVIAGSVARLELKCREVIAEGVDDADKAIVVLLTKLADVSDDSPTERAAAQLQRDEQRDTTDVAERLAHAFAWLADHADVAAAIDQEIDDVLDAQSPKPAGKIREMTRRMMHRSAVLKRWSDAGEPVVTSTGAPTP